MTIAEPSSGWNQPKCKVNCDFEIVKFCLLYILDQARVKCGIGNEKYCEHFYGNDARLCCANSVPFFIYWNDFQFCDDAWEWAHNLPFPLHILPVVAPL